MSRLLIIGQAPSRIMEPGDRPLQGTTALTMLAKYAGLSDKQRVYELAEITNMIESYPGPQPGNEKYDAFPTQVANREYRERILPWLTRRTVQEPCTVVFLGAAVRDVVAKQTIVRAAGEYRKIVRKPEWFEQYQVAGLDHSHLAMFSPHPGGTSMWWNKPENRNAGKLFWTNLFSQADDSLRTTENLPEMPRDRVQMYNTPRG